MEDLTKFKPFSDVWFCLYRRNYSAYMAEAIRNKWRFVQTRFGSLGRKNGK